MGTRPWAFGCSVRSPFDFCLRRAVDQLLCMGRAYQRACGFVSASLHAILVATIILFRTIFQRQLIIKRQLIIQRQLIVQR